MTINLAMSVVSGLMSPSLAGHQLNQRFPALTVEPYDINIITRADVRAIVEDADVVVCAADGVAAYVRTANHVARRERCPLVIAAVLEDGAFGELIRVRPTGCLYCLRLAQVEAGLIDPEPGIDLDMGPDPASQ